MPKKPPKNAFYFFMHDFREEKRKQGVNFANMAEVAEAAGPLWRDAPPHIRTKFETKAKAEKQKNNVPEKKYTSTGISLAEIEQQQRDIAEAEENERKDIRNLVTLKAFDQTIQDQDFYLIDINAYCKASTSYVIGESTVLRFNLREGVRDHYYERINPGAIPVGYAYDVKAGAEELGLNMPDETVSPSNYMQILANLIDYLQQHTKSKTLPPLFTMPDKVEPTQDFIIQMCSRASEDDSIFRIYKLDTLFFTLINAIKQNSNEGFPKESLALLQLKKDAFKYTPGLACQHHESVDKSAECSTARTKRWAYTVLDACCPVLGIELKPGKHVPSDFDINGIMQVKEQKRERAGPSIAGQNSRPESSLNMMSDSFSDSYVTTSTNDTARRERRTHAPLRMPQTDYSKNIRLAPELTEDNFPALSAGRGRALNRSFNNMKINK